MVTMLGRQLSFHPSPGCSAPRAYTLAALQRAAAFRTHLCPTVTLSRPIRFPRLRRLFEKNERERVGCLRVRIQPEGVSIPKNRLISFFPSTALCWAYYTAPAMTPNSFVLLPLTNILNGTIHN